MVSSFVFLPIRGVALPLLMGLGKPKTPAIASVAAGLLNLGLSVLLIRPFGLVGVAVGTAIPNVLFAACVLVVACRALDLTVTDYVKYVVPRAALGAVPIVAVLMSLKLGLHIQTLAGLVGAGTVMMLLFGITWIFFVYRQIRMWTCGRIWGACAHGARREGRRDDVRVRGHPGRMRHSGGVP